MRCQLANTLMLEILKNHKSPMLPPNKAPKPPNSSQSVHLPHRNQSPISHAAAQATWYCFRLHALPHHVLNIQWPQSPMPRAPTPTRLTMETERWFGETNLCHHRNPNMKRSPLPYHPLHAKKISTTIHILHISIHFHLFLYTFQKYQIIFWSLTTIYWVVVSIFL